jgi:hypothetical protein
LRSCGSDGSALCAGVRQSGVAQYLATGFSGLQGRFGSLGYHFPLVLRDGRQNVNCELICMRVVRSQKFDARIDQGGDEGQIAGKPVQLGNDKFGLLLPAGLNGLGKLGAVRPLPGFDFGIFPDQLPDPPLR